MDDSLRLIQSLYGEDVDDPDFARRAAEDEDLRREREELRQTKEALDRRSSPSPDPAVVDRVVARAADAAAPSDRADGAPAPDRPARAPDRAWTQRLQGAAAALLVVLLVGLGWWQLGPNEAAAPGPTASETPPQSQSVAADGAQAASDDMPEWNDHDDLVRLHRRVETLRSRSRSDAWGTDLQTVDQAQP
jgi:hypothetical protein